MRPSESGSPGASGQPDAPPFDAPWQAQAFALTVALNESGHLDWSEWAQYFSSALTQAGLKDQAADQHAPIRGASSAEDNAAYYRAWLSALEALSREKQWAMPLQLGANRESIRAYNGRSRWQR